MTRVHARRRAAVLAVLVLAAPLGSATTASAFPVPTDPDPAPAGTAWLVEQLSDGLVVGELGPDVGLTIDVALSLDSVGGASDDVQTIADAVAAEVDADNADYNYVSGEAFDDADSTYAGAVAKTVVLAQVAGRDTATFGGENFVERLEDVVATDPARLGRIGDVSTFGDNANTIGQSFAVRALRSAQSVRAASATEFLLAQQCEDGFFRLELGDTTADTCDAAPEAEASVDVTALVVLNLMGDPSSRARSATESALAWLSSVQQGRGSFTSDGLRGTPNSNSTGLAGWAFGESGYLFQADRAAVWLRARQAETAEGCETALARDEGAIAYDDAALQAARTDGIAPDARDQFVRATAQATPALRWAPSLSTIIVDRFRPAFMRVGAREAYTIYGFAPGETVCVRGPGVRAQTTAGFAGDARFSFTALEGRRVYQGVAGSGDTRAVELIGLPRATLDVRLKKARVRRGGMQEVRVTGMAEGERVLVKRNGRVVYARDHHRETSHIVRFPSGAKLGRVKVLVVGEYRERRGKATFLVVR